MTMRRIQVTNKDKDFALSGQFFKVVSASGAVALRFFYADGSELETELYQGLGIKHPKRFVSFVASSVESQEVVIFASDAELTDDRSETSLAGAATLISGSASLAANVVQEIVPARLGRRSLLIQVDGVLYIGGANLDATNGVKIDAGESAELKTQAAIYALSASVQDVRILEEVN